MFVCADHGWHNLDLHKRDSLSPNSQQNLPPATDHWLQEFSVHVSFVASQLVTIIVIAQYLSSRRGCGVSRFCKVQPNLTIWESLVVAGTGWWDAPNRHIFRNSAKSPTERFLRCYQKVAS